MVTSQPLPSPYRELQELRDTFGKLVVANQSLQSDLAAHRRELMDAMDCIGRDDFSIDIDTVVARNLRIARSMQDIGDSTVLLGEKIIALAEAVKREYPKHLTAKRN